MESNVSEQSALRFLRSFENAYTGRRNMRRPLVLPKGVSVEQLSPSVADQNLVELVNKNREQILATLRVPKHALSLAEAGSLGSEEHKQALKFFYSSAIIPLQNKISRHLTTKFKESGLLEEDEYLCFDNSDIEVLRDDLVKKAELAEKLKGTWTLNEIRLEIWDKDPVDGGDTVQSLLEEVDPYLEAITNPISNTPAQNTPAQDTPAQVDPNDQIVSSSMSLNGAQISSLLEVINQVSLGSLPIDTAINIIKVSFSMSQENAASMFEGITPGSIAPDTNEPEKSINKNYEDELVCQSKDYRDAVHKAIMEKYSDHLAMRVKQEFESIEKPAKQAIKFWESTLAEWGKKASDLAKRELRKASAQQKAIDDDEVPNKITSTKRLKMMMKDAFEGKNCEIVS
jgi:hypothetical protein